MTWHQLGHFGTALVLAIPVIYICSYKLSGEKGLWGIAIMALGAAIGFLCGTI